MMIKINTITQSYLTNKGLNEINNELSQECITLLSQYELQNGVYEQVNQAVLIMKNHIISIEELDVKNYDVESNESIIKDIITAVVEDCGIVGSKDEQFIECDNNVKLKAYILKQLSKVII